MMKITSNDLEIYANLAKIQHIHNVNAYFPKAGTLGNVTIRINIEHVAIVIANCKYNLKYSPKFKSKT